MPFSDEEIQQLQTGFESVYSEYDTLVLGYVYHPFTHDRSKEYATHGFCRRLRSIQRCIYQIYEISPPDNLGILDDLDRDDLVIYLQAFIFNIFGAIDNLAWIWVYEKNLTGGNGQILHNSKVGLGQNFKQVRESFSPEFQSLLGRYDPWFEYLKDFRHSLAHRIPLYVPPYNVPPENVEEYQRLELLKFVATRSGDHQGWKDLEIKQKSLASFMPVMQHSLFDNSRGVMFHAQILADWSTLVSIANNMKSELDSH